MKPLNPYSYNAYVHVKDDPLDVFLDGHLYSLKAPDWTIDSARESRPPLSNLVQSSPGALCFKNNIKKTRLKTSTCKT